MILVWLAVYWYAVLNYFLADHLDSDEELPNA